mmetsp:Transcript_118565/g.177209  ORF Transcript_118565/g.177209 Transcript_118565/m.177209 type:complete len:229 (-) Transcript_118565:844-1530(-)
MQNISKTVSICRNVSTRSVSLAAKHTLPDLSYDYGELAPYIGARIMELHHSKHHQTYVNNYNAALDQIAEAQEKGDTETVAKIEGSAVRFNGGGHHNHTLFWKVLAPKKSGGGEIPESSKLVSDISSEWGSVKKFQETFNARAAGVQGSGWCWLIHNGETNKLEILTTPNQDQPKLYVKDCTPVLGIDVWEHAYYLDYENRRPDYLKNIWEVVNWKQMEEFHSSAVKE